MLPVLVAIAPPHTVVLANEVSSRLINAATSSGVKGLRTHILCTNKANKRESQEQKKSTHDLRIEKEDSNENENLHCHNPILRVSLKEYLFDVFIQFINLNSFYNYLI